MESKKPDPSPAEGSQVIQEFIVRTPKDKNKRFNVMAFNSSLKVDVTKWTQAKMERENNLKEFKAEEDSPKFGAGSEYGREQKEEARRKKLGIASRQYKSEDQPWILSAAGEKRKFKGSRLGSVTANSSYYVFTQAADGAFEAYPVAEWYSFTPTQCFKPLNFEEAEEQFEKRDKVLNFFSIMSKKRGQGDSYEDDDDDEKKQKQKRKKKEKDFKITDFDEWGNQNDSDDMDDDDDDIEEDEKSSKKQIKKVSKKKKKDDVEKSDEEPLEESDEGDFDDKEVDYITSSSSSEDEQLGEEEKVNRDLRGVEDEEALKQLMEDQEDEEEEEQEKEQEPAAEEKPAKEKPTEGKSKKKSSNKSDSSGESTSESSDSDIDDQKFNSAIFVQQGQKSKKKSGSESGSAASSRAETPTKMHGDAEKGVKRKLETSSSKPVGKKIKTEPQGSQASTSSGGSGIDSINEELLRRYLKRKPMTASELLQKLKSKKKNLTSEQLVAKVADVLKKMDLQKHKIKNKMYLSLK